MLAMDPNAELIKNLLFEKIVSAVLKTNNADCMERDHPFQHCLHQETQMSPRIENLVQKYFNESFNYKKEMFVDLDPNNRKSFIEELMSVASGTSKNTKPTSRKKSLQMVPKIMPETVKVAQDQDIPAECEEHESQELPMRKLSHNSSIAELYQISLKTIWARSPQDVSALSALLYQHLNDKVIDNVAFDLDLCREIALCCVIISINEDACTIDLNENFVINPVENQAMGTLVRKRGTNLVKLILLI
jgi:hypothetical protein